MNAPLILRNNSLICEIDLSEHDSELLDKVMQKWRTVIDEDGVMYKVVLLKDIEELKAEVEQ